MTWVNGDRRFRVTIEPGPDETYGFVLEELRGRNGDGTAVARVGAKRARRLIEPLLTATKRSGHAKSALHARRRAPLSLTEEDGVRLGLVMLAAAPVSKARRIDSMIGGIDSMTTEESYYWYAKATGPDAARVQRSLRLFLAEA